MTHDPMMDITRRTERYWYQDGIWELSFGLVNAILGAFYLLVAQRDWTGPMALVLLVIQAVVIIGTFVLINRGVKTLKERITYPRTGYVAYRRPATRTRIKRALLSALLGISIAILVGAAATARLTPNRVPLVASIIMAAALIYLGFRFSLLRLYLTAGLTIVIGYAVSLSSLSETYSTAAYFGGFGLLMIVSGGITMFRYVHNTSPASGSDDYEAPDDTSSAQQAEDDR